MLKIRKFFHEVKNEPVQFKLSLFIFVVMQDGGIS